MNRQPHEEWQDLARVWQKGAIAITVEEIEALNLRQRRWLRTARAAELANTMVGVAAAIWLALASRLLWVGILSAAFSAASLVFVLRARREPARPGSNGLLVTLDESIAYEGWLAEQLRYGRALGFLALFVVVMAASTQLMDLASATRSGLMATAIAGLAIAGALMWNLALAWQLGRRTSRLQDFRRNLGEGE